MLTGDIDGSAYRTIKHEAEQKIVMLEAKLSDIPAKMLTVAEVESILGRAIEKLTMLDVIY